MSTSQSVSIEKRQQMEARAKVDAQMAAKLAMGRTKAAGAADAAVRTSVAAPAPEVAPPPPGEGAVDDASASQQAAVLSCLRLLVDGKDTISDDATEKLIVSCLKYDGCLDLGTIVSDIVCKMSGIDRGERIVGHVSAHKFSMKRDHSVTRNPWWSAGDHVVHLNAVGYAATKLVPSWVEKLLQQLRARGELGTLTNEMAVAASSLTWAGPLPTNVEIERLGEIFKMLSEAGCDVNEKAAGQTPLHWLASAVTKEEADALAESNSATAEEMDNLLAPLCAQLVQLGAHFHIRGDYGSGHTYSATRKYRGWAPPSDCNDGSSITPPHPAASPLEIFTARGWRACVQAVLHTPPKQPKLGCTCGKA